MRLGPTLMARGSFDFMKPCSTLPTRLGSTYLSRMLLQANGSAARFRQPREARPGIFAPPNAPADATGVRSTAAAAR